MGPRRSYFSNNGCRGQVSLAQNLDEWTTQVWIGARLFYSIEKGAGRQLSCVSICKKEENMCLKVSSGIFQRENYLLAPCKVMAIVK